MAVVADTDPRLAFVPESEAVVPPPGIIEHLKDRWWVVHPEKGLVFWVSSGMLSPQCNRDEACTRAIFKMYPWAEIKHIPSVFRRINPKDYC